MLYYDHGKQPISSAKQEDRLLFHCKKSDWTAHYAESFHLCYGYVVWKVKTKSISNKKNICHLSDTYFSPTNMVGSIYKTFWCGYSLVNSCCTSFWCV